MKFGTVVKIVAALATARAAVAAGETIVPAGQAVAPADSNGSPKDLCGPPLLDLHEDNPLSSTLPYVPPPVDEKYIGNFLLGASQSEVSTTATLFMEAYETDPVIGDYFDFVFTHLSGFNIMIYPTEEFRNQGSTAYASYFAATRTIALPSTPLVRNSLEYIERINAIRHEMRHAAMHTAQLTFDKVDTDTTECYHPKTPEERAEVATLLKEEDMNVERLADSLAREANHTISAKEQKKLESLRNDSRKIYEQHYKNFNLLIKTADIRKKEREQLKVGSIFALSSYGPLTVIAIQDGQFKCLLNDPLYAAVHQIRFDINTIRTRDPASSYILERDAYLHGSIPQPIIAALYPRFSDYTNNIIRNARLRPIFHNPNALTERISLGEIAWKVMVFTLSHPDFFQAENSEHYIRWAKAAFQAGDSDIARMGLNTLIKNRQQVHEAKLELARFDIAEGKLEKAKSDLKSLINQCPKERKAIKAEANLEIARIEHKAGNHKEARKYFKRAEKKGGKLSEDDSRAYQRSLSKAGFFKDSTKQGKKAKKIASNSAPGMRL